MPDLSVDQANISGNLSRKRTSLCYLTSDQAEISGAIASSQLSSFSRAPKGEKNQKHIATQCVDLVVACAAFSVFGSLFIVFSFKQRWYSFAEALFFDWTNPQVRAFLLWETVSIGGGIIVVVLLLMIWHTLSFNSPAMHSFWTSKPWFAPDLMPGGFFARPAAIAVVLMLFMTTCLITASATAPGALDGTAVCERVSGLHCYPYFTSDEHPYAFEHAPSNVTLGMMHSCKRSSGGVCLEVDVWARCTYQCVRYLVWGVDLWLPKVGAILGGSAFVVKIADSLSSAIGWSLVTEDTSPEAILRIARRQGQQLFPKRSCGACALQILALAAFCQQTAWRIDSNGPHTVESTVVLVVLLSIGVAVMQRVWSPAHCGRLYYTATLWRMGKDRFVEENDETGELELVEIDLFEWNHLTNGQRLAHLLNYARRVDKGPEAKDTRVVSLADFNSSHEEDYEMVVDPAKQEKRVVRTLHQVSVTAGAKGTVLQEEGDKVLVQWDHSTKATLVESFYLSEDSAEWDACVNDVGAFLGACPLDGTAELAERML